ncbi:MAG: ribonuclease III, partial [Planctomycetaceae bacterium]
MDKERTEKLKDLEKRISYTFNDISLLGNALTH